jgi:hypothetical protein
VKKEVVFVCVCVCVFVRPTFLWSLGGPVAAPGEIMGVVDAIRRNQKVMHGSWRVEQVRAGIS